MSTNKFTTNNNPTLVAVSNADGETPVYLYADPATHGLVVSATISAVGLATSANQTDGSQKTQLVDVGGEAATVTGGKLDVNATATLAGTSLPISGATEGVGVAILDGSGNQVTSFGGGTQYDEDTASADGQKLTMAGVTRADTAASQVGGDGDRSTLIVDASGRMHVNVGVSALPTGAATSAKQDTGNTSLASIDGKITAVNTGAVVVSSSALPSGASTSAKQDTQITAEQAIQAATELIDDSVATLGTTTYTEAASKGLVIGAVRRDADTTLVNTTNEVAPLQVDANGRLKVEAFSGETLPVSLTSTTITGTVAVTQSGTWDEVGINDSGNSITVDNGGTFATQVDGAALTALQLIDDTVATLGTTTYSEATTKGNIIGAVRRDANTSLVDTTNEVAPLQVNATGELKVAQIQALPAGANAIGKLAANDGVDIGDVTINNASAGSAVNIQDGGNSITVDYATTGSGTATGALRVELPTNGTGVIATVGAVTAITNALPSGTNAIGKLAANSGVDIGDVDVTTVGTITPGTAASSLGKAEDAGHNSGDVGVMALGVRNDAGTALGTTTLDYIPITTDEVGATWVATNGRVSTANSTTANLAGAAAFTGTSEEVKNYAAIQISVFSSHASATDGLSLQQSSDASNWDIADTYTIPATTGKVFSLQPAARYFRLVYTNGGTLTTSLRIQTVFHTIAPNASSQRSADAYTNETDLTQQWTFNSVYNGTTWDRARGDTTGSDTHVVPKTSGGLTTFHLASAGSTNATSVKASAGQLYGWFVYNSNAAARKLAFHNTAGTPTAGASVFFSIVIPPTSGANVEYTNGVTFSTGIGITTVTGLADNDSAAVAANDLIINLFYK